MGVARLRAALDADGWPIAIEVRTAMDEKAPGTIAAFDIAARYYVPNYRFSTHSARFHIPVGTRRGVGAAGATISIARASWMSLPTPPARTRISIAAS